MRLRKPVLFLVILFSTPAFCQLPVYEEPLHRVVFSNDLVRIMDVQAQPGDTSLIHVHEENYCYVTLRGGLLWLDEEAGFRTVNLPDHFVSGIFNNPPKPFVHRFANISSHPVRLITVEHRKGVQDETSVFPMESYEAIILDNPFFRITRITSNNSYTDLSYPRPIVAVLLKGRISFTKEIEVRDWYYIEREKTFSVRSDNGTLDVILIMIK